MSDTSNPWITMWAKPKETIRKIIKINPNHNLFVLSIIYGFGSLLSLAQGLAIGFHYNLITILIGALILSPIWGYLVFSISSFFIFLTGKWLKGQGKFKEIRCAIAWSNLPMIINLFFWIILFFLFKEDIFKDFSNSIVFSDFQKITLFGILVFQLIISIWILVLYINSLAAVQKFSIGKSILNIIIGIIIFFGVFFVASFIYYLILGFIK